LDLLVIRNTFRLWKVAGAADPEPEEAIPVDIPSACVYTKEEAAHADQYELTGSLQGGIMNSNSLRRLALGLSVGVVAWGGLLAFGQSASSQDSEAKTSSSSGLDLERSVKIYNFKTTAESGPLRGEEIYYYKCWICHNQYTIKAGTGALPLKGLFQRGRIVSTGKPATNENVAEKIKNGSDRMPSYRYVLSDKDIEDLLSYLRDERCCFEGDEPPRNPAYRY
jgi:mono/diheme cytochrome c family protein